MERGLQVDYLYLDFSKAFDTHGTPEESMEIIMIKTLSLILKILI